MAKIKQVLWYENMHIEEQTAYNRHKENRRIEKGVIETAEDRGARKKAIAFALAGLKKGISMQDIVEMTELSAEEVLALSRGEELDKDDDE